LIINESFLAARIEIGHAAELRNRGVGWQECRDKKKKVAMLPPTCAVKHTLQGFYINYA